MYTVIVAGILLFPWTIVGVSIVGWLAHRKGLAYGPSNHGKLRGQSIESDPRF
jgi:hypothetical protein